MANLYRQLRCTLLAAVIVSVIFTLPVHAQPTVQGILRLKVSEALASTIESHNISRNATGQVVTGVESLDQLNRQFNVRKFSRVFPDAGKHEARHRKYGLHLWYEVSLDKAISVPEVLRSYQSDAQILRVEPVYKKALIGSGSAHYGPRILGEKTNDNTVDVPALSGPSNDPMLKSQWHYHNTGQTGGTAGADIRLLEGWKIETGKKNVVIAVTDGGVDIRHPDLVKNLWINSGEIAGNNTDDDNNGYVDDVHGYSFVHQSAKILPDNHGTHVAGTVGAVTNNGQGVAGVAGGSGVDDGVRIMSCAVFHADTLAAGFAEAYVYSADNGAAISQNSWGYTEPGVFEQVVLDAIDYFIAEAGKNGTGQQTGPMNGGLVIFSSGNYNEQSDYYPAFYDHVVAVASSTHTDKRSRYSNYGSWIDITAPGGETYEHMEEGIISTLPDGNYGWFMGTSMASPHVSGVAGLILSKFGRPGLSAQAVRQRLLQSVDNIDPLNAGFEGKLGGGRLNAQVALGQADQPPPAAVADLKVVSKEIGQITLQWTSPGKDSHGASAYDLRYSTAPITEQNFSKATRIETITAPLEPGSQETVVVDGLPGGVLFYFAVRSQNFSGSLSAISNVVSTTSVETPVIAVSASAVTVDLVTAQKSSNIITVSNTGKGPLDFTASVSTTQLPFAAVSFAEGPVAPGASRDLIISFDATGLLSGTYHQMVKIESTDPEKPMISIPLTLRVTNNGAPIAVATPSTLDFKSVQIGNTQTRKVRLSNKGSEPLTISKISAGSAFSCPLKTPVTVAPLVYTDIVVAFTPAKVGSFSEDVVLKTNDPAHPTLKISVRGEGLQEAPIAASPGAFDETLARGSVSNRTMVLRNNTAHDRLYRVESTETYLIAETSSGTARKNVKRTIAENDSAKAHQQQQRENIKLALSKKSAKAVELFKSIGSPRANVTSHNNTARKSTAEASDVRQYVTGFEDFADGPLNEQHGWIASQGWNIDVDNPASGGKHIRGNSQASGEDEKFALSPYIFEADEYYYPRYTSTAMRINADRAAGTTWEIVPQDPWSYIATRVRINADGSMDALVIDNEYEFHWKKVPVQVPSGYFDLAIEYNNWGSDTSGFPTFSLFINNNHVFSGTGLGSGIGQVAFVTPTQLAGPVLDIDDFKVVGDEYLPRFVTASPLKGILPAGQSVNVSLSFDATVMKYGSYASDLLIHLDEIDTLKIPTALTVTGPPAITWDLWAIYMEIEGSEGDAQQMTLTNTGGQEITYRFQTDVPGLTVWPESGILKVRESKATKVTFMGDPGIYTGSLILEHSAGEAVTFPVNITVYEPNAVFVVPTEVTYDVPGGELTTKSVWLKNGGTKPVSFKANATDASLNALTIDPPAASITDSLELILTIDARELASGSKLWPVEFATNDPKKPHVYLNITLNVSPDTVMAGRITHEQWTNIPGKEISNIPLSTTPQLTNVLKIFETAQNQGDNYASRVRGYVQAPVSGYYTFYISSDEQSELWLSADEDEANKKKIAWVNGVTGYRQWDKYISQISDEIYLEENHKYYIEALHKEATGGDHLSVGWHGSGLNFERPIPGVRLIPYDRVMTNASPRVEVLAPAEGQRFQNPADVEITTRVEDGDGKIVKVEFFNGNTRLATDIDAPYTFLWRDVPDGSYSLMVKATDNRGAVDSTTVGFVVGQTQALQVVLTGPAEGQRYPAPATVTLSASVLPEDADVARVEFYQDTIKIGEDHKSPFTFTWAGVRAGQYALTAAVTTRDGTTATSDPVEINVEAICTAAGTITREYWKKTRGNSLSGIPVDRRPDGVSALSQFESPQNAGTHYGARIRGFICPPESGEFYFWIASSDKSELWLSKDDDPSHKKRIAMVRSGTDNGEWDKFPFQRSKAIWLEQGQTYYIEALHLHRKGEDHLAVGWQLPGGTIERPIAGTSLSPFTGNEGPPPGDEEFEIADGTGYGETLSMQIYPNPVEGETLNIVMEGESMPQNTMREITIRHLTGLAVYSEKEQCTGDCSAQIQLRNNLTSGVYILQVRIGEKLFTEKLLIR